MVASYSIVKIILYNIYERRRQVKKNALTRWPELYQCDPARPALHHHILSGMLLVPYCESLLRFALLWPLRH